MDGEAAFLIDEPQMMPNYFSNERTQSIQDILISSKSRKIIYTGREIKH
jgi:hypothetical protein